jgi:hypothetical protein
MDRANLIQKQPGGVRPNLPSIITSLSTTSMPPTPSIQSIKSIPTEKSLPGELALNNQQHQPGSKVIPTELDPSPSESNPSPAESESIQTESKSTSPFRDLSRSFVAICPSGLVGTFGNLKLIYAGPTLPPNNFPKYTMRVHAGPMRVEHGSKRVPFESKRVQCGPIRVQSDSLPSNPTHPRSP